MTLDLWGLIGLILALLIISAVFSAAETALTRASRGRLHQLEREGDRQARRVNRLLERPQNLIGAVLLGYNALNVLSSVLATLVLTRLIPGPKGVFVATVVMTIMVVVFVEVLPKTLALARADDLARGLAAPMSLAVRILSPVTAAVQVVVRVTLGLAGVQLDAAPGEDAAREEIRGAVNLHHAGGVFESGERRMLGGVLDLSDMTVAEIMVHRTEISMIDADLPPRLLVEQALEAEHTRLPLYRGERENIVGVLHARDLLRVLAVSGGATEALDVSALMRAPWFVPETTGLRDQLDQFLKRRSHFALVVDEYGALQGLVTLEDILEEIVGEIDDEHDAAAPGVRRQPDGSVLVEGQVSVRDLNRALDWSLPDDLAVTVAGLVIHDAQSIPEPGQTFLFHGHRFQVLRRRRNRITLLRISPHTDPEA
ncbi:MAG: HlyC/CorC family transporter [Alphaproteobacteria bacterium]|jgi:Mg2+/Co2+ transporter CorB|nr:HlyC/CorC family transporter [Alphaproteobacteria bacterium]